MKIDIITLFPGMFRGPLDESIVGRAVQRGLIQIAVHNLRDFAEGRHRVVDDYSFGGGPGMVLKPEPIFAAVEALRTESSRVILMSPQGRVFRQSMARELAQLEHIILLCGHYEGVDERVRDHLVDQEISIGDYILTGGEIAAMVVVDVVVRLLPGVLGGETSAQEESFADGLLEHPQYTRPAAFRGWSVPQVLLSGDHAAVQRWRREQSLKRTLDRRPELLSPEHWEEMRRLGMV